MDLNQLIADRFDVLVESGKIEEAVDKQLIALVNSTVQDLTRSYSDFSKQLQTKLTEVFQVNLDRLDIPTYNSIVMKVISEQMDKTLFASVQQPIADEIAGYIGLLDKKEYNISEIIEKFIEHIIEDDSRESDGEISFHTFEKYSSRYYYFDQKPGKYQYECDYQISTDLKDGKVWYIHAKDRNSAKDITKNPLMGGFEKFMFKLYANRTFIKNDSHQVETYRSRYND